jgi:hypothetical protein
MGICPVCKTPDGVRPCEGNLRHPDTFYCEKHKHVTVWVGRRADAVPGMAEAMARIREADERFWADLGEFLTDEAIAELRARNAEI